ncbi:hypothetical protein SARC_12616, partial [Sphaeroforma arctica JP610]
LQPCSVQHHFNAETQNIRNMSDQSLFKTVSVVLSLVTHFRYYYILCNACTFFAMRHDKLCARLGQWRVSEGFLHLCSLSGGFVGAYIAMRLFRHKLLKTSFLGVFSLCVSLHLLGLWLVAKKMA